MWIPTVYAFWNSNDGGQTWSPIGNFTYPDYSYGLFVSPFPYGDARNGTIVATLVGLSDTFINVYYSPDAGRTWGVLNRENYASFIIYELQINPYDESIWISTACRSTYFLPYNYGL